MSAIDLIVNMLKDLGPSTGCLPSTYLYNEGWMLRLILQSAADGLCGDLIPWNPAVDQWASEAMLATPFSESKGKAFERLTNADGVVGNFTWQPGCRAALRLNKTPCRFEVFEAKMFSSLSKGVKATPWYDQAVRNVACIAHAVHEASIRPDDFENCRLGFWLIAPKSQIEAGLFDLQMSADSMRTKIEMRIDQFHGDAREQLNFWKLETFGPVLDHLFNTKRIGCLSWEELIESINCESRKNAIREFYERCLNPFGRRENANPGTLLCRGMDCTIAGKDSDITVRICAVGDRSSRVFDPNGSASSFLVENHLLTPLEMDPVKIDVPRQDECRQFDGADVIVKSVGPCRSRVEYLMAPFSEEYVDNHRLLKISNDGN